MNRPQPLGTDRGVTLTGRPCGMRTKANASLEGMPNVNRSPITFITRSSRMFSGSNCTVGSTTRCAPLSPSRSSSHTNVLIRPVRARNPDQVTYGHQAMILFVQHHRRCIKQTQVENRATSLMALSDSWLAANTLRPIIPRSAPSFLRVSVVITVLRPLIFIVNPTPYFSSSKVLSSR